MGLLDGDLAQSIYDGFRGQLLTGVLRKRAIANSGGLDRAGDPIAPLAPTDYPIEGFVDRYSDFTRAQAGIPATDLRLCIFGKSLPAGIEPAKDDIAQLGGVWYQVRERAIDPAGALWDCRSFQIKAPS